MSSLPEWLTRTIVICSSLFYGTLLVFRLFFRTVLHPTGPYFWHKKRRDTPPKCLSDPSYGTHKYIQLSEVKLHYVEKGDNTKPLMLFVHGFPEFWYSWRYQLVEFSKDYWTVAVDMRGYGDSDKPSGTANYEMKKLIKDLKELVEALGRKKCILVAHDWGGAIAWEFVFTHPEMIDKYIIMAAPQPATFTTFVFSSFKQFFMSWYVFLFQLPWLPEIMVSSDDFKMFDAVFKTKGQNSNDDVEAYKYTFQKPGACTGPINYYRANLNGKQLGHDGVRIRNKPGLLIIAEKDVALSVDFLKTSTKAAPDVKVEVVKGANHFIQQDAPETIHKLMRSFL